MVCTLKPLLEGAVLSRFDAGTESLDRRIGFGREELVTHSPATGRHVGDGLTAAATAQAA